MENKQRITKIDFLKSIAILLMTLTHVSSMYYTGNSTLLSSFSMLGSTLCFSIFLFSSSFISGIKISQGKNDSIQKVLYRVSKIYVVYLLLGILIQFVKTKALSLETIFSISILKIVPEFTEFLIAFILFAIITKIFFKQLKYLQNKPILFLAIAISLFFISQSIYPLISDLNLPDYLRIFIENIIGYDQIHRFPVTFYFIIFTLGIILSKYQDKRYISITFLTSTLLIIALRAFNLSTWFRWPPSLLFILYGISFISMILLLLEKFNPKGKLYDLICLPGKYPLEQFFLSTFLIFAPFIFLQGNKNTFETIFIDLFILSTLVLYPIVFRRKMV